MFGTRKHTEDELELLDAWDEFTADENPDGFQDAKRKWAEATDIAAFAVVAFEVSYDAVMEALYPEPPEVDASMVSVDSGGSAVSGGTQ